MDLLTARMTGLGLMGGAASALGVLAGPAPGSMAIGSSNFGPSRLSISPHSSGLTGGGSSSGMMLPGDLPPAMPACSVTTAKQILESCYA